MFPFCFAELRQRSRWQPLQRGPGGYVPTDENSAGPLLRVEEEDANLGSTEFREVRPGCEESATLKRLVADRQISCSI
jgi:hypothetical protein